MDNKYFNRILEEVWGKWISVPIMAVLSTPLCILGVLSILSHFSYTITEGNKTYSKATPVGIYTSILVVCCFILLNIFYIVSVFQKNHIRKAKSNKTGILIYLDAPNKAIYTDTERKFGDEFKSSVFDGFDVIFAPFGIKRIEYRNNSIVGYLQKKHCLLFLNIGINSDTDKDTVQYDMQINGTIIHTKYRDSVEKEFQKRFSELLNKFRNVVFPSKEMTKQLRVTAAEMSIACQYIIGLSLFLNGEINKAEKVLSELASRGLDSNRWGKMLNSVQRIRYEIYLTMAQINIDKYQIQCTDEEKLDKMNEYLEKAQECGGLTYEYYLNKAYYYVAKYQDSVKAKEYVNICRQTKNVPQVWKYSEAFLKAYENKSIGSILSSYKSALKIEYDVQDLIIYIENIFEKEPNRIGLSLALGVLYKSIGQNDLSEQSINDYINKCDDPVKAKDIMIKKKLL